MTNFAKEQCPSFSENSSENSKKFNKIQKTVHCRHSEISQLKRNHEFLLASEISLS